MSFQKKKLMIPTTKSPFVFIYCIFFYCISLPLCAQVGINTTSPTATLHIQDTTIPATIGGTIDVINLNFDSYTVVQDFISDLSCPTNGWSTSNNESYECNNCDGDYLYIDSDDVGCDQNATAIINFTPTSNSINISFDYLFKEYSSGSDSFRVFLYDGTSQVGSDLVNIDTSSSTTTDDDFSGTVSVIGGTAYSLRIEYIGSFGYGATFDNLLIQETASGSSGYYSFRLEDGQQQNGYVLTSDANGNATWMSPSGGSGNDDQVIDEFSLSGSILSISLENDGVASETVDLSGISGSDDQVVDVFSLSGNELSISLENDGVASETVDLSGLLGSDDQVVDVFSLSGTILSISLENDGVASETVDLSGIGTGSYTFENGLTESSGVVRLGGILNQNTTLNLDDSDFTIRSSTTETYPGEFIWEGTNRRIMSTNFDDDYVSFGEGGTLVDDDNGSTFTDSGGDSYTRNFILGYYNGEFGGSTISTGSIEYIVDGLDELLLEASSFNPLDDNSARLGGSSKRWTAVWASNGTIQTSDITKKKDIKDLKYGLNEVMKLRPIEYKWKSQVVGKTSIPDTDQQKLLGFSAQELLRIIPEVVETHSWYPIDENGNFEKRKNENLGVRYSEIIPIAIRAIQQQQEQMEEQRKIILELQQNQQKLLELVANKK